VYLYTFTKHAHPVVPARCAPVIFFWWVFQCFYMYLHTCTKHAHPVVPARCAPIRIFNQVLLCFYMYLYICTKNKNGTQRVVPARSASVINFYCKYFNVSIYIIHTYQKREGNTTCNPPLTSFLCFFLKIITLLFSLEVFRCFFMYLYICMI